jgi:pectate lyase
MKYFTFATAILLLFVANHVARAQYPTNPGEVQRTTGLMINERGKSEIPAFPGAEGWGAQSKGGRSGIVIKVTNLNDSGTGSFREAVMNPNPRIVVFDISGTITLKSDLTIKSPFLTIAGQTAPGDGICLKGWPLNIAETHDIIIRCIRVRPGIESGLLGSEINTVEIRNSRNIIIDHCAFSWSNDEGLNNWHGGDNITIQWCTMSEPLHKSIHEKGAHGYGASIGGNRLSFHHNLFANCYARNPSIAGNTQNFTVLLDFRNCVIYNWVIRTCDGKPLSINVVNNYYKPGAATEESVKRRIARIDNSENMGFAGLWYIEGNFVEGYPEISTANWKGGIDFEEGTSMERNRRLTPFPVAPITTQSAREAYHLVLKYAGVIAPGRDSQEQRILSEVEKGIFSRGNAGIIDNVEQGGGWPVLKSLPALADQDNDGMPDAWEKSKGLDPGNPLDANQDRNNDGYTNIEEYINGLVPYPII